jgi:fumarate reductase flavoprotein subunit
MKRANETKKCLSRRDFIKDTATGTGIAAAAGSGLLGSEFAEAGTKAGPDRFSFEVAPPPIPQEEIKAATTADVVVVGAGTAGLPAALSAAQAGATVILIEKMATLQGRGGDNTALNSRIHRKLGIEIDKDRVVAELMRRGEGRLDMTLLYLWANNSGKVMDWIMDMVEAEGLQTYLIVPDRHDKESSVIDKWPHPPAFPPDWNYLSERVVEFPTCHRPGSIAEGQAAWLRIVEKNALKSGVSIQYNTKATQLVRDGAKGRVTAVVAQNKAGDYVRYNANRGVILCTGDYGYNREMVAKYCPQMPLPSIVSTSMGEGHQMAMWIGAVMENGPHAPLSHMMHAMGTDAFLQVNKYGKRFFNEDSDTESMANQLYEQGGAWLVFDDSWEEDVPHMGVGFHKIFKVTDAVRKELQENVAQGRLLKADTIEMLAVKMKVPVETFKATIARYNELVRLKKDLDFGKRPDRVTAVDKPPYYAGWTPKPAMSLVVLGGLLVNEELQAVDKDAQPIPGLYLAGNTVGRRFKSGYPVYCPGLSHSMAFTHGYLAGKFAAGAKV